MIYNKENFERLYKGHYRQMYRLAYVLTEDAEDARDAVSQVFTQLWHKQPMVNEDVIIGYLLAATRNQCLHTLRQRWQRRQLEDEFRLQKAGQTDERQELLEELQRVIEDSLTEKDRRILSLHYDSGMTYGETAEELGVSSSTVNKHITRSLFRIRSAFGIIKTKNKS